MARPSRADVFATPADRAACREAIRQGSRSFHLAGKLLPAEIREPAFAVYAFCRMADDMVDEADAVPSAIADIERCLDRIYGGRPRSTFVERAFADAVHDYAIPREVPEALVQGLSWDAAGRRYPTLSDLRSYAVRVAGSVGVMMSLVMHRRDPAVLARALDLGIAMQLSNICRDVGEDARNGRLYLPEDWLRAAGVDPDDFLANPTLTPKLGSVIHGLLAAAESHYELAGAGIAELPPKSRVGINAARLLYREIGRLVANGVDPVSDRAVVPTGSKLALLAKAVRLPVQNSALLSRPCSGEAVFLVEAVAKGRAGKTARQPSWWDVPGRVVRLVELLATFEAGAPVTASRDDHDAVTGGGRR